MQLLQEEGHIRKECWWLKNQRDTPTKEIKTYRNGNKAEKRRAIKSLDEQSSEEEEERDAGTKKISCTAAEH